MAKTLKTFQSGRGYSKDDWDAVASPPLTDEELAAMRPALEVLPEAFFDAMDERRRAARKAAGL